MRRVVVTGLGLVTPLGVGVNYVWPRLIAGESGIQSITRFDVSDLPTKIGGEVPRGPQMGAFDVDQFVSLKDQKKMGDFIKYAMAAAHEALTDAQWFPTEEEARQKTGVLIGAGIGGLYEIGQNELQLSEHGPRRVSPFFIPSSLINLASGQVSIKYGFKGPNHAVVTACATGAHAIGDAARLIQFEDADVMIAGGTESALCRLGIAGFAAARALSTAFNDTPTKASRPWDQDRDGFVMGEGAGIVVLEALDHALARGATIYGEIAGYGLSGDAYHVTAPSEDGDGAYRAMKGALRHGKIDLSQIAYINAHGTSTPPGDEAELRAVKHLLGDHVQDVKMSSTKSAIGHLLGAAGGVEAIFTLLALRDQIAPPTLNLDNPCDMASQFNLVAHKAQPIKGDYALSNSFGFGGTNASLLLKRI